MGRRKDKQRLADMSQWPTAATTRKKLKTTRKAPKPKASRKQWK